MASKQQVILKPPRPATELGLIAILGGIALNFPFLQEFTDLLYTPYPSPSFVACLVAISVFLIYGVFWGPARAAVAGVAFHDYLIWVFGKNAAAAIQWVIAPLSLLAWFSALFNLATWMLSYMLVAHGVAEGAFWRNPLITHATLAVLVLLGLRGDAFSFGRSSIWLCKVALVSLLGLLLLHWNAIPQGQLWATDLLPLQGMDAAGFALQWFSAPLVLAGGLLIRSNHGDIRRSEIRLQTVAWMGIAGALLVGVWLCVWTDLGSRATLPKSFGLSSVLRGDGATLAAKALVLSLSMLIPLRLGPRLLFDLWKIPKYSITAALVLGGMVCAAIMFGTSLVWAPLAIISMVGIAGTLCAASVVSLAQRSSPALLDPHGGAHGQLHLPGAVMRTIATILSTLFAIAVDRISLHAHRIVGELADWNLSHAAIDFLAAIWGVRLEVMMPDYRFSLRYTAWVWAISFAGSLIATIFALYRRRA